MNCGELYDVQTIEVMQRILLHDSNVADVGCHSGEILHEMLKLAPDGHHLAFEPLLSMFAMLEAKFGGNSHVSLFNLALSDVAGTVDFQHVVSNPAYSGIRKIAYDRPDEIVEKISVTDCPATDGDQSLGKQAFCDEFYRGRNYYFTAA